LFINRLGHCGTVSSCNKKLDYESKILVTLNIRLSAPFVN